MLRWISLVLLICFTNLWAAEPVVVETNPRNPVKGEVFQILFKCQTEGDVEPEISFTPEGFEILGKQIQGLSTRTVFSQGQYTTTRELLVSYDARAPRAGRIAMKNVVVKIDGRVEREDIVPIQVIDAPAEPKLVFVAAEVSKKTAYVGEGIVVRYHVYTKTALQAFDIKKYPKLDGFMKRYLQENENPQRVTVDGDLFRRSVIYSVRLYPEKAGKLVIDPMEISATYANDIYGNMGFGFGLGMRDMKTRLLASDPVEIEVRAVPEANKPASFNGLVGEHRFELKPGRSQILVNEPLEVRLTITGPGNLENLEAPALWSVPQLEKFDAKADLNLVGSESAVKTFDYTYLGKRGGEVPAMKLELSYFDPATGRYHKIEEQLPSVIVAGSANGESAVKSKKPNEKDDVPQETVEEKSSGAIRNKWWANMSLWWGLLALAAAACVFWRRAMLMEILSTYQTPSDPEFKRLSGNQYALADLVKVLYRLSPDSPNVRQAVKNSDLSPVEQQYFLQVLDQTEAAEFHQSKKTGKQNLSKQMLRALRKNAKR